MGADQSDVQPKNPKSQLKPGAAIGPKRMRFWGASTRDKVRVVRMRLLARALPPKARSHDPITAPERLGSVHGFKFPCQQTDRLIETVG